MHRNFGGHLSKKFNDTAAAGKFVGLILLLKMSLYSFLIITIEVKLSR